MFLVDCTDFSGYQSQTMDKKELSELYRDYIDKTEYNTFSIWFFDMVKSGLITEI